KFGAVRIGKRFELTVDGPVDDALLAEVRELAEDMLANTVIEDVVSVHEVSTSSTGGASSTGGSSSTGGV
ncbi:MAG: phosphoribosylformylglycinamidine synthase subunit PurS, partial [Pseudolysinimonas sp.]